MGEIELTWGCLEKTVEAGILPWDITVQVINSKQLPTQKDAQKEVRYRLILWDGNRTYKNALFSSDNQQVPDLYSVIRIGTDTVSENTRESVISRLEKGEQISYAYMFFNYILVKEGDFVQKKIYKPEQNNDSTLSPTSNPAAAPEQSTPPNSAPPPHSGSLHTPPNPPPLRRPNFIPRPGTSEVPGPTASTSTPPGSADRKLSRESVKRNLVNSYPPEKRRNSQDSVDDKATHQVAALNPMMNRYSIKVRVSKKEGVREVASSRWQGKVNSCKLSDHSGDIALKAFNAEAEKLDSELQNGFTYLISGAKVSPVRDSRYNSTNHNYELTWSQYTKVTGPFLNSAVSLSYKFVPISSISDMSEGENLDLCAWVKETGDVIEFRSRNDRDLKKRELVLVDNSTGDLNTISLTLWNKTAEEFNSHNRVLAIKGAKVGEWNNMKNLSLSFTGSYEVEPDVPGVQDLVIWANTQASTQQSQTASSGPKEEFCTIQDLRSDLLAHKGEKRCRLYGWITRIKHENVVYRAHTPTDGTRCQKKILENQGRLECAKCNKRNIPTEETTLRFSVRMSIADCTDTAWCSVFDAGQSVFNMSADRIHQMKLTDELDYQDFVSGCSLKPYIFHVIAKIETYNDAPQLKLIVNDVVDPGWDCGQPMDQSPESRDQVKEPAWRDVARHMRKQIRVMEDQLGVSHTQLTSATWNQFMDTL